MNAEVVHRDALHEKLQAEDQRYKAAQENTATSAQEQDAQALWEELRQLRMSMHEAFRCSLCDLCPFSSP